LLGGDRLLANGLDAGGELVRDLGRGVVDPGVHVPGDAAPDEPLDDALDPRHRAGWGWRGRGHELDGLAGLVEVGPEPGYGVRPERPLSLHQTSPLLSVNAPGRGRDPRFVGGCRHWPASTAHPSTPPPAPPDHPALSAAPTATRGRLRGGRCRAFARRGDGRLGRDGRPNDGRRPTGRRRGRGRRARRPRLLVRRWHRWRPPWLDRWRPARPMPGPRRHSVPWRRPPTPG